MKNHLLVALVGCLIGMVAAGAYAAPGQTWGMDFNGTTAATINNRFDQNGTPGWHWGWDNLETPGDGHAYDATEGIGGALKLLDDEQPAGFESSHLAYDVGERSDGTGTLLKWGGVVVARVKDNSTTGSGVGFGYSSSDGNHTGILGIKNGSVSMTGWEVANGPRELPGSSAAIPGGNVGKYRTYALGWSVNLSPPAGFKATSYNVWMLNEGAGGSFGFSNNPADWTQIITNITPRSTSINNDAAPDANAIDGVATGIQLGSWGPGPEGVFGRTASGDLDFDWIGMTQNKDSGVPDVIKPWQVDGAVCLSCGDSDGDGVPDDRDFCPYTIPNAPVDILGCTGPIPGDWDRDGDVDSADLAHLRYCMLGPNIPQNNSYCASARLDGDNDVDMDDFGRFQRCYSGYNRLANPNCGS